MSFVGCSFDVFSGCHLYADSPFTYAIRPECSAGLVVIEVLGSQIGLGIRVALESGLRPNHAHQAVLSGRCQVKAEAAYKCNRGL